VGRAEVGRERLLTEVALKRIGVIAALKDQEHFDRTVEGLSMRGSPAWDTLDRSE
jgi:hypothetical protein